MQMPQPDAGVLAKKPRITARLRAALGPRGVIDDPIELRAYECDGLSAYRCPPLCAVLPASTDQVSAVMKICHEEGVPVVPRGAGTSLSGGALPTADAVLLGIARMNRVLETDYDNRFIRVEAGRTNLSVTGAVEQDGFFYAPDPSSQLACAIAGNIAMNSGGAHCLKYGVTTNNLMGVTMVMADGEVVEIGGAASRRRRARPARPRLRLRRPARRRHRGDRAHPRQARRRAPGPDRLRYRRGGRRLRRRHHRVRHHPGRDRVHGPSGDHRRPMPMSARTIPMDARRC